MKIYFPGFLKFHNKTPDDLIEEALVDSEIGEDMLDDYFSILKEMISFNSARVICYALFQGFYSHNKVNTKNWAIPEPHPSNVKSTDDNYPVWQYNEKTDEFELNRPLLQDFFNRLNPTHRAIAFALIIVMYDAFLLACDSSKRYCLIILTIFFDLQMAVLIPKAVLVHF